jgi:hypothetical protein
MAGQHTNAAILRSALKANGIEPRFDRWLDTQKLGAAVRDALKGGK